MRILKIMILFVLFGCSSLVYAQGKIQGSVLVMPFENKTMYVKVTDDMDSIMRDELISNAKLRAMCLENKTQQLQSDYVLESSLISYDGFAPYSFIIRFQLKDRASGTVIFNEVLDVDIDRPKDRKQYAKKSKSMNALIEKAFEDFVLKEFTEELEREFFLQKLFKRLWRENEH